MPPLTSAENQWGLSALHTEPLGSLKTGKKDSRRRKERRRKTEWDGASEAPKSHRFHLLNPLQSQKKEKEEGRESEVGEERGEVGGGGRGRGMRRRRQITTAAF